MDIAVCIKQVPFAYSIKFDAERKTMIREGVSLVMSSMDRQALWEAIAVRDRFGGSVTALTMGPPQARDVLVDALVTGADRAIHLLDPAFAGADTLATARALTAAIRNAGPFDLVLCGRFTNDAETGQVGPEIAEFLDLPQVTNVQHIEWQSQSALRVRRETDEGFELLELHLPAVITAGAWLNKPVRPTREEVAAARDLEVETCTAANLGLEPTVVGAAGSPTWVGDIRTVPSNRTPHIVDGSDPEAAAAQLLDYLLTRGLFTPWPRHTPPGGSSQAPEGAPAPAVSLRGGPAGPGRGSPGRGPASPQDARPRPAPEAPPVSLRGGPAGPGRGNLGRGGPALAQGARPGNNPSGDVWVLAELLNNRPKNVTYELLGKAADLIAQARTRAQQLEGVGGSAEGPGGEAVVIVIGTDLAALAPTLVAHAADRVLLADYPALQTYDTEAWTAVLTAAIQSRNPAAVLFPATVNGRDLAPRVAARLGLGLTGDCIDLELDSEGRLAQLKPAFGGNIVAPIYTRTTPALATVRPGIFPRPLPDETRQAEVETLHIPDLPNPRIRLISTEPLRGDTGTDLDDAEVVVGIGQGVETPENVPIVAELAKALGGTIAASLRAVETGILPSLIQVGLTGKTIAPRFYIAVGVRGYLTHMMGVQKAGTIAAINTDPNAEIFKSCDFGIVGDLNQIVPALTRAINSLSLDRRG